MRMIHKTTPSSPGYAREGTVPYRTQGSQWQLSAVTAGQWLDLSLMTKEGDKVTLSADAKASALHTDFEAMQVGDGGDIYAQWGELSLEQRERDITLTVEGDLNPAERREIRKVLQTINNGIELPLKAESESLAANMARMVAGSHGPGDPLRQMADELLKACRNRIGQRHPFGGRVLDHIRNLFQNALKMH